jgi:hypothetical protein
VILTLVRNSEVDTTIDELQKAIELALNLGAEFADARLEKGKQ